MFLNDIDPQFIKSLHFLYSSDTIMKGESIPLQFYLEEAIKSKMGVAKDLTGIVASSFKQRKLTELRSFINGLTEESKGSSSDNELELDLLKEDLMCIVCKGMDVGARNRLLECSDCHMLYHQECHKPIVINQDTFDTWVCQNCKDASKKMKISSGGSSVTSLSPLPKMSSSSSSSSSSSISSSKSTSSSHRHNSNYKSSSSSSKTEKYSKSSSTSTNNKSSTSSTSKSASNSSSSRTNVTPNINIISADKRIQIMKKKAAKQQEKRLTRIIR